MFRPEMLVSWSIIVAIAGALALGAIPAGAAEGGANAKTHKLIGPGKRTVRCRICAGTRCTVVSVRRRCTKRRALAALETRLRQRKGRAQRALPEPQLDDRSYKQLEEEGRGRIPPHTPEWTDHKGSDPGATILEIARRNSGLVRVQKLPPAELPEQDDEVIVGFEHGDPE